MTENQLRGFDTVRVAKSEVLARLQANREEHKQQYDDAIAGWRTETIKALKASIKELAAGGDYVVKLPAIKPENHTADYDRIIELLTYSKDDEFELSVHEFAQYVRDEWSWKGAFAASFNTYSASAAAVGRR